MAITIILDTNVYLRIARDIRPLLGVEFGGNYIMYVHEEFRNEFNNSKGNRLKTKFYWANQNEFILEQQNIIKLTAQQRKLVIQYESYLNASKKEMHLTTSPVDIKCLAVCLELEAIIATDDPDMLKLAEEYGIKKITVLELLKLLNKNKIIDISKIESMIAYWEYDNDLPNPRNFHKDYKRLFG
jgi:predicted DNA-binding protein (UPF0278 family)